jgi:hypothetical protein
VFRVARCATGLFDLVFYHRHDRVVGYATLTRTVVVQNVTETQPALLHRKNSLPRDFRVDWLEKERLRR